MLKLLHYNLTPKIGDCMTNALTKEALLELLSLECRVCIDGSVRYYNAQGQIHRVHGPAIEYVDGALGWFQNGQLHRLDGPAVEQPDGYRAWWQNELRHRIDGPAVEHADGGREWWQNGQRHRVDGPAVDPVGGRRAWYINGKLLTKAKWQKALASMENV